MIGNIRQMLANLIFISMKLWKFNIFFILLFSPHIIDFSDWIPYTPETSYWQWSLFVPLEGWGCMDFNWNSPNSCTYCSPPTSLTFPIEFCTPVKHHIDKWSLFVPLEGLGWVDFNWNSSNLYQAVPTELFIRTLLMIIDIVMNISW